MKALIVYFSGTGNTEMITVELVSRLRKHGWEVEAVSIEQFDSKSRDFNFRLRTMDMLGFGFPVYKLSYPEIMEQLFPFISFAKPSGKPFFVFSTYCRFPSTALHRFALRLGNSEAADSGQPHTPVALRAFKCPSNGIASMRAPESRAYREVMYFVAGIGVKLDDFAAEIITGYERFMVERTGVRHRGRPFDGRRERLAGRIEKSRYPVLTVYAELCIGCGLCAKRCPDDNLFMERRPEARPIAVPRDAEDCLHCLRCMHICPKKAITFGPLVQGPSRYTAKVRKALFAEAAEKSVGASEPGSRMVRFRWAAGNLLRYLLRSR